MATANVIDNDSVWRDTAGRIIDCHEGCVVRHEDAFYWLGRTYAGNPDGLYGTPTAHLRLGFVVYRSDDLFHWTPLGSALEYPTASSWLTEGTWHRPRLVRDPTSGQWVLWYFVLGTPGQAWVRDVVAVSDSPAGPFHIVAEPQVSGLDVSGDMALWQEPDGRSYLANGDWQRNGWVLPLRPDCRDSSGPGVIGLAADPATDARYEGICLARYRGKWLLAGSGVAGLSATETTLAVADEPLGPYRNLGLISENRTWGSQIGSFLYLPERDCLLALCDRWLHDHTGRRVPAEQSAQLWLPLEFDPANETARLDYVDRWNPWTWV